MTFIDELQKLIDIDNWRSLNEDSISLPINIYHDLVIRRAEANYPRTIKFNILFKGNLISTINSFKDSDLVLKIIDRFDSVLEKEQESFLNTLNKDQNNSWTLSPEVK